MPTIPAAFRGWKPSVNFYQFTSVPVTFVSKLADKFSPTSITNALRQFMVFHHIFDSQVFNYYRLVFTHQLSS
jgi:hypothetical protein